MPEDVKIPPESENEAKLSEEFFRQYYPQAFKEFKAQEDVKVLEDVFTGIKDHVVEVTKTLQGLESMLQEIGKSPELRELFKEQIAQSAEFRKGIEGVVRGFEGLGQKAGQVQGVMSAVLSPIAKEFKTLGDEIKRSAGFLGEMVGNVERLVKEKSRLSDAMGGAAGSSATLWRSLAVGIPIVGAVAAALVVLEKSEVLGKRAFVGIEGVTTGMYRLGAGIGETLNRLQREWKIGVDALEQYVDSVVKSIGVAWRGIEERFVKGVGEIIENVITLSKHIGISVTQTVGVIERLMDVWGRTEESYRKTERWIALVGEAARGTVFTKAEFLDIIDRARVGMGLFGMTVESSARLLTTFGAIAGSESIRKGVGLFGPEAFRQATGELIGFEQKLVSNIGQFLYFMGELRQPLRGLDDLYRRLIGAEGLGELGKGAIERYHPFKMILEHVKMLQGFGLSPEVARMMTAMEAGVRVDVMPMFIEVLRRLEKVGREDVWKDVEKFLEGKIGADALNEVLKKANINISAKELKELQEVYKKLSVETTDPLSRLRLIVESFVKDVFVNFAKMIIGLLVAITDILRGIFHVVLSPIGGRAEALRAFREAGIGLEFFGRGALGLGRGIGSFVELLGKEGEALFTAEELEWLKRRGEVKQEPSLSLQERYLFPSLQPVVPGFGMVPIIPMHLGEKPPSLVGMAGIERSTEKYVEGKYVQDFVVRLSVDLDPQKLRPAFTAPAGR